MEDFPGPKAAYRGGGIILNLAILLDWILFCLLSALQLHASNCLVSVTKNFVLRTRY